MRADFTPAVRLLIRTRAGGGDPFEALCECCGRWIGRHGGQIQHRVSRGAGGTSLLLLRSPANGALMTPACHARAESRSDPGMEAAGFYIRHGVGPAYDPRYVPVNLHGSGVDKWLSVDGRYLDESPIEEAA
jgi:hypothetical protein